MTTAAEQEPEALDDCEDDPSVAADARVYRDKQGGLWLDPMGDGNVFAFDSQCRTAMTEKWGTSPIELVASQFELVELVPALERRQDWAVRWRFQVHHQWAMYECLDKTSAVIQRNRLREAGVEAELWSRPGSVNVGAWQCAEDQA